jgi:DNA-binding transcriptional MerR regulator
MTISERIKQLKEQGLSDEEIAQIIDNEFNSLIENLISQKLQEQQKELLNQFNALRKTYEEKIEELKSQLEDYEEKIKDLEEQLENKEEYFDEDEEENENEDFDEGENKKEKTFEIPQKPQPMPSPSTPRFISAQEIADFWEKPIENAIFEDLFLEVYKVSESGSKKIVFPYEEGRTTTSGGVKPPLFLEEIKAFGPGRYAVKLRDSKKGKILQVQTVIIPGEEKEKTITITPQKSTETNLDIVNKLMEQNKEMLNLLLKTIIETKKETQVSSKPAFDIDKLSEAFTKGLETASNLKMKEVDALLEKIKGDRELQIKKMELEHELKKLQLTEGVTVGDVVEKLEEEGKEEQKNTFLNIVEGIVSALGQLNTLASALGLTKPAQPGVAQQPFRVKPVPQPPEPLFEEGLDELIEEELKEPQIPPAQVGMAKASKKKKEKKSKKEKKKEERKKEEKEIEKNV